MRRGRLIRRWVAVAGGSLAIVAVTSAATGLDPALILKPLGEQWPTYSGDYTGRRYSSLTQINQSDIKNMTLAWASRLTAGPGGGGGGRVGRGGGAPGPVRGAGG